MSDPTPPPAAAAAPAPKSSGSRVVIIVVCVIFGMFLLIGGCVATCVYVAAKKAREISRSAHDKPVYTSILMAATLNPDVQVVSKDEAAATITVRNKRTGEVTTIDTKQYNSESVTEAIEKMTQGVAAATKAAQSAAAHAQAAAGSESAVPDTSGISAGKAAAMDDIVRKLPASAPGYPGGATQEASLNAVGSVRTAQYTFLTLDKIDAVLDFYAGKAQAVGYALVGRQGSTNDEGPTGSLSLSRTTPPGAITVTAETRGGGRLAVTLTLTEGGN
ncbi:MAG TPA: hypothetical protein VGM73_11140 [Candidatus Didemnitutus sp.]|jgi:hypothetical protein